MKIVWYQLRGIWGGSNGLPGAGVVSRRSGRSRPGNSLKSPRLSRHTFCEQSAAGGRCACACPALHDAPPAPPSASGAVRPPHGPLPATASAPAAAAAASAPRGTRACRLPLAWPPTRGGPSADGRLEGASVTRRRGGPRELCELPPTRCCRPLLLLSPALHRGPSVVVSRGAANGDRPPLPCFRLSSSRPLPTYPAGPPPPPPLLPLPPSSTPHHACPLYALPPPHARPACGASAAARPAAPPTRGWSSAALAARPAL